MTRFLIKVKSALLSRLSYFLLKTNHLACLNRRPVQTDSHRLKFASVQKIATGVF